MVDIKNYFNDIAPIKIYSLMLKVNRSEDFIPADLLGQSQLTLLYIWSSDFSDPHGLNVDSNAFRASKSTLIRVKIEYFPGSFLDLSFLAGFENIDDLTFGSIENINITTFPALPSLTKLSFFSIYGLNETFQGGGNSFLETSQGLEDFTADGCNLDTNGLANLLDWILPSSAETLKSLSINSNYLSSIPVQMSSFRSIESLKISGNFRKLTIGSNAIHCYACIYIDMSSSNIRSVESDAFQGAPLNYIILFK